MVVPLVWYNCYFYLFFSYIFCIFWHTIRIEIPDGRLSSVTTHWPFKSIVCRVARAVSTVIMTRNNNFLVKEYISQRGLMLLIYLCLFLSYQIFPGTRQRRAFWSHVTQSENESAEINYVCHNSILSIS